MSILILIGLLFPGIAMSLRDFQCDELSASRDPVCFPSDYSRMHKPAEVPQVAVELDFTVQDISEVDDFKRTMTVQLYFTFSWPDPR